MKHTSPTHTPRMLLAAGLMLGMAAAQASTITHDMEASITPGMSRAEVQRALGQPVQSVRYDSQTGPTLTYSLAGLETKAVDITFNADDKVSAVSERMVTTGDSGGSGGH